ncbi:hypothetical protein GCM10022219_13210 [Microbacterium oryzae]|uniref:hypothetical protein n=1 Tax=Microbacterium oryzae TaxID=743009 RepID=UPI00337F4A24
MPSAVRLVRSPAGATLEDVLSTRVIVASSDQVDLIAAWEVVRDAFGSPDAPDVS